MDYMFHQTSKCVTIISRPFTFGDRHDLISGVSPKKCSFILQTCFFTSHLFRFIQVKRVTRTTRLNKYLMRMT